MVYLFSLSAIDGFFDWKEILASHFEIAWSCVVGVVLDSNQAFALLLAWDVGWGRVIVLECLLALRGQLGSRYVGAVICCEENFLILLGGGFSVDKILVSLLEWGWTLAWLIVKFHHPLIALLP